VMLLSSCSSAKTSTIQSPALQPVAIQGTKAEVVNLAFETAKKSFPDGQYEMDHPAGIMKINRGTFFGGHTLITITCEQQKEDSWLVHANSKGIGFNKPMGDRSSAEREFYLNVLRYEYNQLLAARSAKEAIIVARAETPAAAPEIKAVESPQKAQVETPKAAEEIVKPAVTPVPAVAPVPTVAVEPAPAVSTPVVAKESPLAAAPKVKVIGNSDSKRYHLPGMKYYNKVAAYHRVEFDSEADAIKAGYHRGAGKASLPVAQAAIESPTEAVSTATQKIKVIGNSDSKRYHLPGMKYYKAVEAYHRVEFDSENDAIKAGYHKARR
jgi:hypothetical protein